MSLIKTPTPENFAFIINAASVSAADRTLSAGHVLRPATKDEVLLIKKTLEQFQGGISGLMRSWLWEAKWPLPDKGEIQTLPENEWRYYVIAFHGTNETICDIQTAADLAPVELELGLTVMREMGEGVLYQPDRLFHVLSHAHYEGSFLVEISDAVVQDIKTLFAKLQHHDAQLLDVKALAERLGELKGLPKRSPLRFLGYFAILESLLTHPPKPSDPYDSITRQVKKKIALLDNRWNPKLNYGSFSGASEETIWGKMYTYRSLLAHGTRAELTGELAILKSHEQALALIKETVKSVARQGLIEPQLLLDLKNC